MTNQGSQLGFLMACLLEDTQTHLGSQRQPQVQISSISISLNFGEFFYSFYVKQNLSRILVGPQETRAEIN